MPPAQDGDSDKESQQEPVDEAQLLRIPVPKPSSIPSCFSTLTTEELEARVLELQGFSVGAMAAEVVPPMEECELVESSENEGEGSNPLSEFPTDTLEQRMMKIKQQLEEWGPHVF